MKLRTLFLLALSGILLSGCYVVHEGPPVYYGYHERPRVYGYYERPVPYGHHRHHHRHHHRGHGHGHGHHRHGW